MWREPPSEMHKVTSVDGTSISYERSGSGPPLVLVHGTVGDRTRWGHLLPELERHFTVCAIDRRGRGESGDVAGPYSIEREFEDIAAVLDSSGATPNLLGHSYGALCVLGAALHATRLHKLVVYEPIFHVPGLEVYPPGIRDRLQTLLDKGHRDQLLVTVLRDVINIPEEQIAGQRSAPTWEARVASVHTLVREMVDEDYRLDLERIRKVTTPTLLLQGSDSPHVCKVPTEILASVLPNSRIAVMPGQGHVAMDTGPDVFLREVIRFLKE